MEIIVKHALSGAAAKGKILKLINGNLKEYAGVISDHQFNWDKDNCDFNLEASNMNVLGKIDINKTDVKIAMKIPIMLTFFASTVEPKMRAELVKAWNKD